MTSVLRQIGTITRPHGLRGEVKVRPDTDDPGRFEVLERVMLGSTEDDVMPWTVTTVRFQTVKGGVAVVLSLDGIDSREKAEDLAGLAVWADEADLPPLEDGEVFLSDLVGLVVCDSAGTEVGTVADVLDLPAQPVLVVRRPEQDDVLVPFVSDLIERVSDGRIAVRPIEGLLSPDRQESVE